MSFRKRLLFSFLFLFAISIGSMTCFLHFSAIESEKKTAIQQLTRNTTRVLHDLETFVHDRTAEMATMATARVWTDNSSLDYVTLRLKLYRDYFKLYDRIYVINEQGTVFADSEPRMIGTKDEHPFRSLALDEKNGYEVYLAENGYTPSIYFYHGLISQGKKRVLVSRIPFSSVSLLIRGFDDYQKAGVEQLTVQLMTDAGDLLFTSGEKQVAGERAARVVELDTQLKVMAAHNRTSDVAINKENIVVTARSTGHGPKKPVPWVMRIGMPTALLFHDIYIQSRTIIIISVCLTVASMLLIWFTASGLSKPLEEIASHARILGSGDFSQIGRLPRRSDEFGILVENLQNMAEQLKTAIDTVRLNEERWKFALEGAGDGVWDWDARLNKVFFSPRWKSILGYEEEELDPSFKSWKNLIHPDDVTRTILALKQHLDGSTPQFEAEHRLRCKDGGYKWILTRGLVIRRAEDGSPLRVIGTHTDITLRKLWEEKLVKSEEKFRLLANFTADWEYWVDADKKLVYTSPSCASISGYEPEEFYRDPELIERIVHPPDQEAFFAHLAQFHAQGTESGALEFRIITKGGNVIWIGHLCHPVVSSEGVFMGRRVSNRNITGQKLAEESLHESKEKLSELNSSLETSIQMEVEKNRQKDAMMMVQGRLAIMGEMLGNIAHQWRQPLNNLGLMLQLMREDFMAHDLKKEQMDRYVGDAMEHIRHMSKTIDDFRNFFRQDKSVETYSINRIVRKALLLIDASFRDNGISVEIEESEEVTASGYPGEYSQVLMNLLGNAKDALIERKVEKPRVHMEVFRDNKTAVVTVRDNAGGIAEEILDRIFDPYFTTKDPGKGTGIGLYIAKTIIEKNMQGRLTVQNIPGGAEFRIEIEASE